MEIVKLQIQNFLTVGGLSNLALSNQGLTLIQGINEDDSSAGSNGAGKSSIADALCWGLFGETAREESGDAVVNDKVGKDCFVKVTLKDNDVVYEITRYRKHKEFKNQTTVKVWEDANGFNLKDLSKGTEKETQELVTNIVGCSLNVFVAAIYAGQEAIPDIPKMTDKQLKLLIEEAAGVERLEAAYEIARKDALETQAKINGIAAEKANVTAIRGVLQNKLDIAQAKHKLFEESRQARSDQHKQSAKDVVEEVRKLNAELATKDEAGLRSRLSDLQAQVAGIKQKQDIAKQLQAEVSNKESALRNQEFVLAQAKKQVQAYQNAHDNAETEMAKPCHACGKPHDPSEIETFKKHQLESLNTASAGMKQIEDAIAAFKEDLYKVANAHMEAVKDVDALNPQTIFNETNTINSQLANIKAIESDIARLKTSAQAYVEAAKGVLTEPNPEGKVVDYINEQIQASDAQIADAEAKLIEAEKEAEVTNAVVKVFSPAGVRAHILDTVTPFLNDRTSDYLSALSDGNIHAIWTTISKTAKGDLKEKFNIEVSNDKGGKSFKLLSGGEKRKVRLATMLALQDLVASRATKPINIWIGDEIDHALDEAGLERLMGILDRKARERGTVLVISHNSLSDWVDNVTTVTKRGGTSTIEGSLCL